MSHYGKHTIEIPREDIPKCKVYSKQFKQYEWKTNKDSAEKHSKHVINKGSATS